MRVLNVLTWLYMVLLLTFLTNTNHIYVCFSNAWLNILGRATLQNWSLVLYGTKHFDLSDSESAYDVLKQNKVKLYTNKKKNNKNKQRNEKHSTKSPSLSSKAKAPNKSKNKNFLSTPKYFTPNNLYPPAHNSKKKFPKPTEGVNFFYAVNNSKFRNGHGVKEYLKFVKNITITYPVMIPALDNIKSRDSFRKIQKQKEKSRDINSNSNHKLFTTKSSPLATTHVAKFFTAKPRNKTTGNMRKIIIINRELF